MPAPPDPARRRARLRQAYLDACALELRALKPGNVHIHAGGHSMEVAQFETSARVSADPLTVPGHRVGARIEEAIVATHAAVGCNTNLGIVLLAAPLIAAAERAAPGGLRDALAAVLGALDRADAVAAYAAIRLAAPAGLGQAPEHDVATPPSIDLRQAMAMAAERDRIARQYATVYEDVFEHGVARLAAARREGEKPERAAMLAYMDFLAAFPDSHLERKHGRAVAEKVRADAQAMQPSLATVARGEVMRTLLAFDRRLKSAGLNPGTSADLTVASLLALGCEDMLMET